MRILQVCSKLPYPPSEGGSMAMNMITQGLLDAGHQVKVLAVHTHKQQVDSELWPETYKAATQIQTVFIDTKVKPLQAFLNLFSSKSYNIERFVSVDFAAALEHILQSQTYDAVIFDSLFVSPYLDIVKKISPSSKTILRAHNIEHLIWQRMAQSCRNPVKKIYLKLLAQRLKKYELSIINQFNGIAAITAVDKAFFEAHGCSAKVANVPIAYTIPDQPDWVTEPEALSLFHIGSMDWMPNQEAVKWFVDKVWPVVTQQLPDIKLYLAGRNMPEWLKQLRIRNIEVVGEVEHAQHFVRSKWLMIVPLLSGSGMRVKIIEAMALRKTVISTTIGAEGIECKNGEDILIADTADDFARQINYCIQNPEKVKSIGNSARQLIETKYNNKLITDGLVEFIRSIDND